MFICAGAQYPRSQGECSYACQVVCTAVIWASDGSATGAGRRSSPRPSASKSSSRGCGSPGFRLEHLGTLLRAHRSAETVGRVVAWILRADLIVVDDVGLLEVAADAAYEERSIAVSSNLHPAGFESLIPKNPATATVDRLPAHAHAQVGQTSGDSIRLTRALAVKGVTAMN